jgi:transcriptional regulator with XRE-family HTH domain
MAPALVHDLGGYLREQRKAAQLSLRQLSELAGISNPYLSQIERGLKKPSAEILQQIARGLQVSAESLYVKAGILDAHHGAGDPPDVLAAIAADHRLNDRQRHVLVDVYRSLSSPSRQRNPPQPVRPYRRPALARPVRLTTAAAHTRSTRMRTPSTGTTPDDPSRDGSPRGTTESPVPQGGHHGSQARP